jgi:hypothetical protein
VLLDGNIARTVALKHDGGHYGDVIEFLDSLEVVDGGPLTGISGHQHIEVSCRGHGSTSFSWVVNLLGGQSSSAEVRSGILSPRGRLSEDLDTG